MSELTLCNFCTLRGIKIRAKAAGAKVVLRSDSFSLEVKPPM